MTYSTDVIRRIVDESEGVCVEIGPWPESPQTCVEIRTVDEKSRDWFGKVSLTVTREMAAELGRALLAASEGK